MKIIKGNILDAKEQYIAQQSNCLTINSAGLAKALADKWFWADAYSTRMSMGNKNCAIESHRDKPGTIRILSSPDIYQNKHVICMFAQWCPGPPLKYKSYPNYWIDTKEARVKWFQQCLDKISKLNITEIAFPYNIGCGLAQGHWPTYQKMIEEFESKTNIRCTLYMI